MNKPREAFVLVAVLVVVLLASMVAVSLMFRMQAEELAAHAGAGADQAWATAMSGVVTAMEVAAQAAPGSLQWRENPEKLRQRMVYDDGADQWFFTVYSAATEPETPLHFGLTDEAGRLNILTATEEMLLKLPRMTAPLAQALSDYLDPDFLARPEGAEQEYYEQLPVPYPIRNGPLVSLEQLLQVRGFTPLFFYGEDVNLNGLLDSNEDDGGEHMPLDNNDGELDRGLRPYLTVSSYEPNVDNTGLPRRNLNDPGETFFDVPLPESVVQYVDALRRNKIRLAHPADLLEAKGRFKDKDGKEVDLESGVDEKTLALLLDKFTTTSQARVPGLVNVLTASAIVLQTVPGIDLTLAESIVAARARLSVEQRSSLAWLYEDKIMDASVFKQVAPRLTTRSAQFRFNVVGYAPASGRYRVLEAALDLGTGRPVLTYLRDLTSLGMPFPITRDGSQPHG